jgi:hypothetical protein
MTKRGVPKSCINFTRFRYCLPFDGDLVLSK